MLPPAADQDAAAFLSDHDVVDSADLDLVAGAVVVLRTVKVTWISPLRYMGS
jgi:hypothetical protein